MGSPPGCKFGVDAVTFMMCRRGWTERVVVVSPIHVTGSPPSPMLDFYTSQARAFFPFVQTPWGNTRYHVFECGTQGLEELYRMCFLLTRATQLGKHNKSSTLARHHVTTHVSHILVLCTTAWK
jgi:hypothetical protein